MVQTMFRRKGGGLSRGAANGTYVTLTSHPEVNVMAAPYNAKGDAIHTDTGSITNGTNLLTITGGFAAGDVGKTVQVLGAGVAAAPLITTITSVIAGVAGLATTASTTVSFIQTMYGTDDTAALTAAAAAWLAILSNGQDATLKLPPRGFLYTSQLTLAPTSGNIVGGVIDMEGASLLYAGGLAQVGLSITTTGASHTWSFFSTKGGHLWGGGFQIQTSSQAIYGGKIHDIFVSPNGLIPGIDLSGCFETELLNPKVDFDYRVTPTGVQHSAIYVHSVGGSSTASSIDIVNPTTRGGWNGIYGTCDVKTFGGTVLQSWHEGVQVLSGGGGMLGTHLENTWLSNAVGDNAAVRAEGGGTWIPGSVTSHTGVSVAPYSGTSSCNYALRCYVYGVDTSGATIAGTMHIGPITHVTNVTGAQDVRCTGGSSGSQLLLDGVGARNITVFPNGVVADLGATTGTSTLLLPSGEAPFDSGIGTAFTLTTQREQLAYFTAQRYETCTQIVGYTAGQAAAATPTLCQYALYTVDASDNLTPVANTANDTTLFAATNTKYARSLTANYVKIPGQRLAVGLLVVSTFTNPSMYGRTGMGGTGLTFNTLPRRQGRIASQTVLPSSTVTASGVTTDGNGIYLELTP